MILHACVHVCSSVAQLCPTLCDPMVCTPLDSSVHGIFQARILEWAGISCSMRSPWPRNWTHVSYVSCIGRQVFFFFFLNHCATWEAGMILHRWQNCMELTHTHTDTHTHTHRHTHRHTDTHTHTHRHAQMRTSKTEEVRIRWVNYININVLALILCYSFEKQNVLLLLGETGKVYKISPCIISTNACDSTFIYKIQRKIKVKAYRLFREGDGTPLQYSCLENPMDGGAW